MVQSEIGHFTWRSSPVVRELGKANSYWLPAKRTLAGVCAYPDEESDAAQAENSDQFEEYKKLLRQEGR